MKFVGPKTVHGVHWLAEKSKKSQTLRLLFIKQYMNSSRKSHKRVQKKKTPDAGTGFFSLIQT